MIPHQARDEVPQTESWQLRLFGKMELIAPSGESIPVESRKCAELLAFLAVRRSEQVSRDQIGEALWPDSDLITARNRLKQTLSRLRKCADDLPILCHGKHEIELSKALFEVDLHAVERRYKWLRTLRGRGWADAASLILSTTSEGLLVGMNSLWIEGERRRYEQITQELSSQLSQRDPSGVTTFRLGDELGVLRVPIIGRGSELEQISTWVASGDATQLMLVGPPGVGKTRLLSEVLTSLGDQFDAIVTLSTVQFSETRWRERLAQAAGISDVERYTRDLIQLLRDFKRPLLAIDDCDQADSSMTEWVERLMAEVPRLRMIGTARRHPSDVRVQVIRVSPLESVGPVGTTATDLLIRFATHVGVSDAVLSANRSPLEEMAELLEGLPLSLEIMAGWMPMLNPESLLARLRSGPEMLVKGAAKGRKSLVEIVSAILQSLSEQETAAILFLSLCKGGCGERLAESVLGTDWPWSFRSLSERSLVSQVPGTAGMRFLVLQAVRESVLSLSGTETLLDGTNQHAEACVRLGMIAAWGYAEGDRRGWLNWMRDEADNLLAACSRCLENRETAPTALELLRKLRHPFWLIGRSVDHQRVSDAAFLRWDPEFEVVDTGTTAFLVEKRINALMSMNRSGEAANLATAFRRAQFEKGDPDSIAVALDFEAHVWFFLEAYDKAIQCFEEASRHHLSAGRNRHALWIEAGLAKAEIKLGLTEEAIRRKHRAFERAMVLEDLNSEGMYCKEFALAAIAVEDWPQARTLAEQSVRAFERAGETTTRFEALLVLAGALIGCEDKPMASLVLDTAERDSVFISDRHLQRMGRLRQSTRDDVSVDLVALFAEEQG